MEKALPSPCTPIPPKTFIPLRAPGLKLRPAGRRTVSAPSVGSQLACLFPHPFPSALARFGFHSLLMTELTQVQHLSLRLHDTHLAGLAYGAPIPIVCLASAYQSYAGTHPMSHGGEAMESVTVRRIFRHSLRMVRADKPSLPPARHRLPFRLPDRPINALFVLRVCRFRECRSTHAPKFLEIS